jgi:hypothetical protein
MTRRYTLAPSARVDFAEIRLTTITLVGNQGVRPTF